MEMEIEGENGSKILVEEKMDLGRGLGFDSTDRTVSRRHVSFKKLNQTQTQSLCFQVIGKNPIWVRTNNEIRVYKSTQQGELKAGDSFCVSSKNPLWFHLKGIACQDDAQIDLNNQIDPLKEFSFVVMGHEFDCYPIPRHIRNWNWFLQQPSNEEEEEEDDKKSRNKRKKGGKKDDDDDDDDIWTCENEDDVEVMKKKLRNDPKPKYSTRSKDKNKNNRNGASKSAKDDDAKSDDDDDEDEDEGDETLGGFLVDDEDRNEEEEEEEDDEEEEFEEEDDEDDDDDDDDE